MPGETASRCRSSGFPPVSWAGPVSRALACSYGCGLIATMASVV